MGSPELTSSAVQFVAVTPAPLGGVRLLLYFYRIVIVYRNDRKQYRNSEPFSVR